MAFGRGRAEHEAASPTTTAAAPTNATPAVAARTTAAAAPGGDLLRLQRSAGNHATNTVIRRFAVPGDFAFGALKRASLPISVDMTPIKSGEERHHVIGDRSILKYLDKAKTFDPDKKQTVVTANAWAASATKEEARRAKEALDEVDESDLTQSEKYKHESRKKGVAAYDLLTGKLASAKDEGEPLLDSDELELLLPVLEWMPPNLIIDTEKRRYDPGDQLDIEAVMLHTDLGTRTHLLTIAIAMGEIPDDVIGELTTAFKDTKFESNWTTLVDVGTKARGNYGAISKMLADLQTMVPGMKDKRTDMKTSKTGKKQKLGEKGNLTWRELIVRALPPKKTSESEEAPPKTDETTTS